MKVVILKTGKLAQKPHEKHLSFTEGQEIEVSDENGHELIRHQWAALCGTKMQKQSAENKMLDANHANKSGA